MSATKIQYLDRTWSPIKMLCHRVSAGCANCWHMRMANRMKSNPALSEDARLAYIGGKPWLDGKELEAPLKWRKPQRVGVQFMGDLFHDDVHVDMINLVFCRMAVARQHTFLILTKRPKRMLRWFELGIVGIVKEMMLHRSMDENERRGTPKFPWPLPNVHIGVSVEDQKTADERIPLLLQTPAAVRWISAEPLLGQVNLHAFICENGSMDRPEQKMSSVCEGNGKLNWTVVGGESGPKARPCDVEWIRSIVQQCKAASVPVFVKQMGANSIITAKPGCAGFGIRNESPYRLEYKDRSGADMAEWPEDLCVRQFPK